MEAVTKQKNARRNAGRDLTEFCVGSAGYGLLEIAWRGFTHISMVLLGGICFLMLLRLARRRLPYLVKCAFAGLGITLLEFLMGCLVNLWLGLAVWDYSEEAYHLLGQVCPRFLLLWCVLGGILFPFCLRLDRWLAGFHPGELLKQIWPARKKAESKMQ